MKRALITEKGSIQRAQANQYAFEVDADANKMATTLVESWPDLQKDFPALRPSKLEDLPRATNVAPFHPGAAAAYKSKNMWTAKNDEADKKVM